MIFRVNEFIYSGLIHPPYGAFMSVGYIALFIYMTPADFINP